MAWNRLTTNMYTRNYQRHKQFRPSLGINEYCFIRREHECGKLFNASKSCFVACPTNEDLEPILGLISEKLAKVGIEPIIAIKERSYGQDIFCTKICGKIIESRFCIVILDDTKREEENFPNPNVYYEYGLMTSMKKHIIPLQRDGLKLAFNIQSHDTIKYTPSNINLELERAIRDAIIITENKEVENMDISTPDRLIHRKFELSGFPLKDSKWILSDVIQDTNFLGFGCEQLPLYVLMGKIDERVEQNQYLDDLEIIIYRTEKMFDEIHERIARIEEMRKSIQEGDTESYEESYLGRLNSYEIRKELVVLEKNKTILDNLENVIIGFIINDPEDKDSFINKANEIIESKPRYKLVVSDGNKVVIEGIEISLEQRDLV